MKFKIKGQEEKERVIEFELQHVGDTVVMLANKEPLARLHQNGKLTVWESAGGTDQDVKVNLDHYAKDWIK